MLKSFGSAAPRIYGYHTPKAAGSCSRLVHPRGSSDTVRAAPFGHRRRLAFVAAHDVDLIDLHLAPQLHRRRVGNQTVAKLLRHDLHVRGAKAQLACDLPVREVQPYEVVAQDPYAQRLVGRLASTVPVRLSKRPAQALQRYRCWCGCVSSHPSRITAELPHPGQHTLSGQRSWRKKAKHLASSIRPERLIKSGAAMMAKSPRARRGVALPPSDQGSVRHATQAQKPPPWNPTRAISYLNETDNTEESAY